MHIKITESIYKREKPDQSSLGFGNHFTDHMFVMDYIEGDGWCNPSIEPYAPISLDPSAMVFHYGQSVFEGLKAYLSKDNEISLFRPENNLERLNRSASRMCIPQFNTESVLEALKQLLNIDREWIPTQPGTSLYIRPFIFATDSCVGVRASNSYKFIIILSPVGSYYSAGFNPISIFVEQQYVRAVKGGIGCAKTAGNYAASIKSQSEAKAKGFSQVLWLDGINNKYIEEVGAMNVFFKIDNEIITPELNGSILDGITRRSTIELLTDFGYKVTERRISIDEIVAASEAGTLEEMFGTGTAAVISPVGELWVGDNRLVISDDKVGELSKRLYDTITGIQTGRIEDRYNWTVKV